VSTNCGVAMREGNDVIVIDMCNGHIGRSVPRFEIKNRSMFSNKTEISALINRNTYVVSIDFE